MVMNLNSGYAYTAIPPDNSRLSNISYPLGVTVNCKPNMETIPACNVSSNKPLQIHVNPKMCVPRNIYINKAFTAAPVPPPSVPSSSKPERVYYNPKFLKKNITTPAHQDIKTLKKESNIYINPNFIKNEQQKLSNLMLSSKPIQSTTSSASHKPTLNKGIHVNPMFLKNISCDKAETAKVPTIPSSINERLNPIVPVPSSSNCAHRQRFVSKYKIDRKKVTPALIFNYYNLKRLRTSAYKKINKTPAKKKNIKIVKGRSLKYVSPNIINQSKSISLAPYISEFKTIGLNKLVRKSVLQNQIESRMRVRKVSRVSIKTAPLQIVPTARKSGEVSPRKSADLSLRKRSDKVSKYKIVRASNAPTNRRMPITNKSIQIKKKGCSRKKGSSLVFLSLKYRADLKKKKIAARTKKLKKNNQPCPFYNRYGHCKGKDKGTCQKLHDPKYIAICKRFVKGDCKDEKCTLSHDVRPEKMPTCHHYLAGLCKRTHCPYLHIKVNPKAPICRAFLQGFCADVFNCTKRHEYLCPMYAEQGSCLRQKSCPYPHRSQNAVNSKLLAPDEFPLLNRKHKSEKTKSAEVSTINQTASSDASQNEAQQVPTKEPKPKEFKRYFLASLSDNESHDDES